MNNKLSSQDEYLDEFIQDLDDLLPQTTKKPSIKNPPPPQKKQSNLEEDYFEEFIEEPLSDPDKPLPQKTAKKQSTSEITKLPKKETENKINMEDSLKNEETMKVSKNDMPSLNKPMKQSVKDDIFNENVSKKEILKEDILMDDDDSFKEEFLEDFDPPKKKEEEPKSIVLPKIKTSEKNSFNDDKEGNVSIKKKTSSKDLNKKKESEQILPKKDTSMKDSMKNKDSPPKANKKNEVYSNDHTLQKNTSSIKNKDSTIDLKPSKKNEKQPKEQDYFQSSTKNKKQPKENEENYKSSTKTEKQQHPKEVEDYDNDFESEGIVTPKPNNQNPPQTPPNEEAQNEFYEEDFEEITPRPIQQNLIQKHTNEITRSEPKFQSKSLPKSPSVTLTPSPPNHKASLLDLKSKFNAVLKHHLAIFEAKSNPTSSDVLQENKILLKLIKDFNGIISQEIDKNLPRIQTKVDFLHPLTDPFKTLEPDMVNNNKILSNLREELEKFTGRKEEVSQRHYFLNLKTQVEETKIQLKNFRQDIHRFGYEIEQDGKTLDLIENCYQGIPESLIACQKVEEELAVCEVRLKGLREKTRENKKFKEENQKKEEEAQQDLEEVTQKALEMGINLNNEELERKYRGLKKKIPHVEKDCDFLKKRNEKIEEIWMKEMEDIRRVSEDRERRTRVFEKGIEVENEIIERLNENGEMDEEIYQKIESLRDFGGVSLLGDRIIRKSQGKNTSFIEEARKKLAGNLSFISTKDTTKKKTEEIPKKSEFLKKEIKETSDDLKETQKFEKKKQKIEEIAKVEESPENLKENSQPPPPTNPFKFNFKKGKNNTENNGSLNFNQNGESNNNSSQNNSFFEKNNENASSLKTFNFKKSHENNNNAIHKSMDTGILKQNPEETTLNNKSYFFEEKKKGDPVKKSLNLSQKTETNEIFGKNENEGKNNNFDLAPKKFNFSRNKETEEKKQEILKSEENENATHKSPFITDSVKKEPEKKIEDFTKKPSFDQEIINKLPEEQPKVVKTFNFAKNKENPTFEKPISGNNVSATNMHSSGGHQNSSEKNEKSSNIPQILAKPTQKQPRNIFMNNEENEKPANFGKIMEIPEIKDVKEIKPIAKQPTPKQENKEKRASWLLDDDELNLDKREEIVIKKEEKPKVLKKKIQDPFESNNIADDIEFGAKKEEKKGLTMNLGKKAEDKPNFNSNNNDFFKDFDL